MKKLIVLFALTVFSSLVVVSEMTIPPFREFFTGSTLFLVPFGVFFLFSVLTIVSTFKAEISRGLKWLLLVTGGSGAAIFVSILLHNFIYGVFVHFFGEGIWNGVGGDEPVFFVLGLVVFPVLYLIGTVGTMINLLINWRR